MLADDADDILRTTNVGLDGLKREVLAGWYLFEGSGVEYHIRIAEHAAYAVEIPDVTNLELQQAPVIIIDDLISGDPAMLIGQTHLMLFGLVAGKHDEFLQLAKFA